MVRAVTPSLETVPPFKISVPPPNAESFPIRTFPAETVNPPANVFAPLNVNAPAPCLVSPNDPPTAPLSTTPVGVVSVVAPVNVPTPLSVMVPLFVKSPKTTEPVNEKLFANARAVVEALDNVPPVIVRAPDPNA
jgi:hypothetical protein